MSTPQAAAVELFSTSILSNHKIRSRHERYVSILTIKKIPFVYHDLAGDEEAKSRWRRKARDPQIPGLLVHNEWRGTFDEFEESIEFGELNLFLKIDHERVKKEAQAGLAPAVPDITLSSPASQPVASTSSTAVPTSSPNNKRAPSHTVKQVARLAQPRAPSQNILAPALPFAPSGSGTRKEHDAESFLNSLGISDLNLSESELAEILDEGKSPPKPGAKEETNGGATTSTGGQTSDTSASGDRGLGKYPSTLGLGTSRPVVPRTYIPSAEAGIKPLRLARMGAENSQRSVSTVTPLKVSPSARYNASQISSKALTAEAQASISSRSFSSLRLREAVSKGNKLEDAFKETRIASNTDACESIVGREDLDDLMSSLGLNDVKMSEEEAEAFLLDGTIPTGLASDGERVGRAGSVADRARKETAARDIARRQKEKGYGSSSGGSTPKSIDSAETFENNASEKEVEREVQLDPVVTSKDTEGDSAETANKTILPSSDGSTIGGQEPVLEPDEDAEPERHTILEGTPRQESIALEQGSHDTILARSSLASTAKEEDDDVKPAEQISMPPEAEASAEMGAEVIGLAPPLHESADTSVEATKEAQSSNAKSAIPDAIGGRSSLTPSDRSSSASLPANSAKKSTEPSSDVALESAQISSDPAEPPTEVVEDIAPPPVAKDERTSNRSVSQPLSASASLSPIAPKRQVRSSSQTPSRKGMDYARPSPLSPSSDIASPTRRQPSTPRSLLSSPTAYNLPSSTSMESVKSARSKKFFGIGRLHGRKSSGKRSEASDSGEDETVPNTISSPAGKDRSHKTLSMILREADEAMRNEEGDDDNDDDDLNGTKDSAFDYELDDLDEDDGIEVG